MREINVDLLISGVEERIKHDVENSYIAGAAVYVSQHGKPLINKAFGYSDFDAKKPLETDNLFRIASMSKPVLAAAVAILADRGEIDLFAPITRYLPRLEGGYTASYDCHGIGTKTDKIPAAPLVHQLLNHSSGLGSGGSDYVRIIAPEAASESLEKMVDFYAENLLYGFAPGEKSEYSPIIAFDIAARIIEVVTGGDYRKFVAENIFEPLSMSNTCYVPNERLESKVVEMFFYSQHGIFNLDMRGKTFAHSSKGYSPAGAGLLSTAEDYAKFAEMLCFGGVYRGKRILSENAFKLLTDSYLPEDLPLSVNNARWALGFTVEKSDTPNTLKGSYHWGGAYGTTWFASPENELVGVYMKNSFYAGMTFAAWGEEFERDVISALE